MSPDQIIGNAVIDAVVGFFLIVVGAVLQPLLKRLWERMNRPLPLTPQTRGQLVMNRTIWEGQLERLDYLSTHAKDLFLYLIQLVMVALLLLIAALLLYVVRMLALDAGSHQVDVLLVFVVVLLTFAGVMCGVGLSEARRLSEKRIEATRGKVQKRIDEINRLLNPPA
jgi:uncharacterized membrane protein